MSFGRATSESWPNITIQRTRKRTRAADGAAFGALMISLVLRSIVGFALVAVDLEHVALGQPSFAPRHCLAEESDYSQSVERIVSNILALESLHGIDRSAISHPSPSSTTLRFDRGITGYKPNPEFEVGSKVNQRLAVFENNGISLAIHFYFGEWRGAWVPPYEPVGGMRVTTVVEGPLADQLRQETESIVSNEAQAFKQKYGDCHERPN